METARVLADLLEISPQIEAAVVFGGDGATGSVGVSDSAATALALAGRLLLGAADGGERVTQVHAQLKDGEVFAVAGAGDYSIVAVASSRTAPGLVFYDLKRSLALVAEPDPQPEPSSPRRRWWERKERGDAS